MKTKFYIIPLLMVTILAGCKKEYAKQEDKKTNGHKNVAVTSLERLELAEPVTASGTLYSKEEIILSFKIGGIVQNLNVEEGNSIGKGQRLGSLNLTEINAQVVGARNAYDKSVRDLERATNLYRDTVGTLEQKQNAHTAMKVANSNLDIARFNQRYALLKTPIEGKVLKRFVEVGELVSAGQPIYKIGSSKTNGSQIVRLGLSDKDIIRVEIGDEAIIEFDALSSIDFKALVTEIAESSNPRTGLFEVELTLKTFIPELKNGFIAKTSILPSKKYPTLKIPMNALVEGKGKTASIYYTEDNMTLTNAKVDVLDIKGDYFTVSTSGIPENAKVITRGAPFLKANDSIHIIQ